MKHFKCAFIPGNSLEHTAVSTRVDENFSNFIQSAVYEVP
jgi:hypothetical protein